MSSQQKVALITGSSSGIGKQLAIQLAQMNYHVLLHGKDRHKLQKVHEEISLNSKTSTMVELNLTDFQGIDRLGFEIHKEFKKLDILILNAGILGTLSPIAHQDVNEFMEVININLVSNFRLITSLEQLLKN